MVGDAIRALDVGPVALEQEEEARARPGRPAGRAGRPPRSRRPAPRRGGTVASAARPRRSRPADGTHAGRTRRCCDGRPRPRVSSGPGRAAMYRDGSALLSTSAAAARYFSMRIGGTNRVEALLSNPPPPPPSAGKASAGRVSTPSRSRIVLLYCRRVSRWIRLGPGSRTPSTASRMALMESAACCRSSTLGPASSPGGGMVRSTRASMTRSQSSGSPRSDSSSANLTRLTSPLGFTAPWQRKQ